jgi:hypothetical protein
MISTLRASSAYPTAAQSPLLLVLLQYELYALTEQRDPTLAGGPGRRPLGPVRGDAGAGVAGEAARAGLLAHGAWAGGRAAGRLRLRPPGGTAETRRAAGPSPPAAKIRPHDYQDAAPLLADFWATVDAVLRERGVIEPKVWFTSTESFAKVL